MNGTPRNEWLLMRSRRLNPVLMALGMALLSAANNSALPAAPSAPGAVPTRIALGSTAPDFSLPDMRGETHTLHALRGHVVVLNFWAFWCDTWKAEMPQLQELAARQDELGFRLLAISVDGTRLKEFASRMRSQRPFPVLLDVGGVVRGEYGVTKVPTVIIIDRAGRVRTLRSAYPGNPTVLTAIRAAAGTVRR